MSAALAEVPLTAPGTQAASHDKVIAVNLFPFKSLQKAKVDGQFPASLTVGPTGFEVHGIRDREYVLLDVKEGTAATQRGWPKGSEKLVYEQDAQLAAVQINVANEEIGIYLPGYGSHRISTEYKPGESQSYDLLGKEIRAIPQDKEAGRYFSGILGRSVELVRIDHDWRRELEDPYRRPGASNQVAGADGMPFLLISQASLDLQHDRNGFDEVRMPADNLRANIVIDGYGIGALAENMIDFMKINHLGIWAVKACKRCPMPSIDQVRGLRDKKVLKVLRGLSGYRREDGVKGVFFGQNLNHSLTSIGGQIAEGDLLEVVKFLDDPNVILTAER